MSRPVRYAANIGKRGYRPKQAQRKAETRRKLAVKPLKMTLAVIALIEAKLSVNWSPEQVSGWLKVEKALFISHERIYQHIWTDKLKGGTLYKHLRHLCPSEIRVQWQETQAVQV
jgi:transposase, IS30 family